MKSIKVLISKVMLVFPDKLLNQIVFTIKQRYIPNVGNPRTLSEKILHIKLYDNDSLRVLVADRVKVREYVLEKSKDIKFSKILWHGREFAKEVWDSLPDKFVLKGNHGSGMIYFVNKENDLSQST